jgi:hypothetical protein
MYDHTANRIGLFQNSQVIQASNIQMTNYTSTVLEELPADSQQLFFGTPAGAATPHPFNGRGCGRESRRIRFCGGPVARFN